MSIKKAGPDDMETVKDITLATISDIYPRYYPRGVVQYFIDFHNDAAITEDIDMGLVYLCYDQNDKAVGTVTVKKNEILRLFVLPAHQGKGHGRELLEMAEKLIAREHSEIILDSSLPAKRIYLKRGYRSVEYRVIGTPADDMLCYDLMVKKLEG